MQVLWTTAISYFLTTAIWLRRPDLHTGVRVGGPCLQLTAPLLLAALCPPAVKQRSDSGQAAVAKQCAAPRRSPCSNRRSAEKSERGKGVVASGRMDGISSRGGTGANATTPCMYLFVDRTREVG